MNSVEKVNSILNSLIEKIFISKAKGYPLKDVYMSLLLHIN